jgi:hypothetical protein
MSNTVLPQIVGDVRQLLNPGTCVLMFELLEHHRHTLVNEVELSSFDMGELNMVNRVLESVPNNTAEEWLPVLTENTILRSLIRNLLSDKILHYAESINHHMVCEDDDDIVPDAGLAALSCGEDDDDDDIVDAEYDEDDDDVAELDDLFTDVDDDDILPAVIADELAKEANIDSEIFRDAQEFGALAQSIVQLFTHVFREDMDRPHVYLVDMYSLME